MRYNTYIPNGVVYVLNRRLLFFSSSLPDLFSYYASDATLTTILLPHHVKETQLQYRIIKEIRLDGSARYSVESREILPYITPWIYIMGTVSSDLALVQAMYKNILNGTVLTTEVLVESSSVKASNVEE